MSKVITVTAKSFLDAKGEIFIPRGINMVCKDPSVNYIGNYSLDDFNWLHDKGFNLIRLGIFWAGAEPNPGEYDLDYFIKIDEIIDKAALANIPVFLDMHQDLYGIKFEDGAPLWATIDEGCEHVRTKLWSESYLMSAAVQRSFDNFWANSPAIDGVGLMEHYINLWKFIADRYKDHPYVIGYDVMNEPFPGTPGLMVAGAIMECGQRNGVNDISEITNPEVLLELIGEIEPITADFEENTLNPFYRELCKAIRSVDTETIFMFESNYFANAGIPSHVEPAKDDNGNLYPNQVYAPHGYDILVDTADYSEGGTERVDMIFMALSETIKRLPVPTVIGEWGCYPNASSAQLEQARHLLSIFDALGIGNVYFDYSHIKDGHIIKVLS